MAVLKSIATGNFLTSTTWGLVDATSYLNSETGSDVLTTAYSGTRSSGFTPGVITVEGIGVKLSVRTGTTGTMSVSLRNETLGLDDFVTGTEVTIDTADLPVAATADLNGGWMYFEFATPVVLLAANIYNIQAKTSSATQVSLFRDGTTDNISRILVTSTTQAPAAGDDLIIAGEYIDQSTFTTFTVTMDALASSITDYGAASTSLVTPSLAICNGGVLTWGTTAATAYYLRQSGNVIIYSGGTMNMGTTGTPCPRDSSQKLNFDCGANVDFGLTVRNLGTFVAQGLSRTAAKLIVSCKLNTDEAVDQTTLGVDTDTGWLDNDEIAIASTTRTNTQCEKGTLNGAAGASSLTVDGFGGAGGGVAFAHSGTSPTQAEVILLTRNVSIFGASATLQAYIRVDGTSTLDIDWVEFYWLGSATGNKRGFEIGTTTGTSNIQYSSLHNFEVASSQGFVNGNGSGGNTTFSNNVTYLIANIHYSYTFATSGTWTADSNIFMRNTDSANLVSLADIGGTFTNNTMVGSASNGFVLNESGIIGTVSGNTIHSNASIGILWNGDITNSTLSTFIVWRNGGAGLTFAGKAINIVFATMTFFGNSTSNITTSSGFADLQDIKFISATFNGDTSFSTVNGVNIVTANLIWCKISFYSCDFSTVAGIKTAHTNDFNVASTNEALEIVCVNCKLGGTSEVTTQTNLAPLGLISSQKHDQTAGNHKTWKKYGTITIDTTADMYRTASPSERLTPNNASNKLISGIRQVAVSNGAALTPSVYVRESVSGDGTDYNGARARLIVKRNDAIGITADTVLDTATASAEGAFEQLTGATATATDNGVMEFYVDCDGTTGWISVDDWTCT